MRRSDSGTVRSFQAFLRRNSLTFACAESCTGGLFSQEMTALAGSSQVFWGGAVTYADEAKTILLGVPSGLIDDQGAVSGSVAESMVRGLIRASRVPLAVAITGVAGPGGGTEVKPVGTVWFGLASVRANKGWGVAVRTRFFGSRTSIQRQATRWARMLAVRWWESDMDLDSLRSLTDNKRKTSIEAFQPPFSLPQNPIES